MTLDELIKELQNIKKDVPGDTRVYMEGDTTYSINEALIIHRGSNVFVVIQ